MTTPRRRQRLSADERREQIMAATVQVLAEQGYRGASADAIVRRADVSKGLLWHYFGSRDDLMEQTAKRTLLLLRRAAGAHLDLTAPAPDIVRAAVRAADGLRHTHGDERRALEEIIVNLRTPDGATRLTLHDYEDTYASQEAIFRRGQDDGDFRTDLDARVLAVTYSGAVEAMLGYLDAHPDVGADRYVTELAEILLGGIERSGAVRQDDGHVPRLQ